MADKTPEQRKAIAAAVEALCREAEELARQAARWPEAGQRADRLRRRGMAPAGSAASAVRAAPAAPAAPAGGTRSYH